jgi:hypothetical protein
MEKEPIMEKLEVRARINDTAVEVFGDTFHVKDVLKELKFKWDYMRKVWYVKCSSENDVNYILFELEARLKEKGVGLVIEGVKNEQEA